MKSTHDHYKNAKVEVPPKGSRHISCKNFFYALFGMVVLAGIFLFVYTNSRWDASGIRKRLQLKPKKSKMTLKLAICQYGTRINNLSWNLDHAIDLAEEAFEQNADYVILPEFSFTGLVELKFLPSLIAEFEQICGAERLSQVARRNRGYLQFNHPAEADGLFWNESILLNPDGEIAARYHKRIHTSPSRPEG